MASFNGPKLTNPIRTDVPDTQEVLVALVKQDPTSISDIPVGAKRLYEASSGKWQWQEYNGSSWAAVPFLQHNVDQLDGYHAAITPSANTVAVRGTDGKLKDDITGNAATASSAATLSQTLPVNKGGTGATTSEAARVNLGVPPTSHTSTDTTYGVGNATQYGHLKLSDATDSVSGVSGGVAATPAAVKVAKEAADAAQSSADAAMTKASTLATNSTPGIIMPHTGDNDGLELGADGTLRVRQATETQLGGVTLSSSLVSNSATTAATSSAVKALNDWKISTTGGNLDGTLNLLTSGQQIGLLRSETSYGTRILLSTIQYGATLELYSEAPGNSNQRLFNLSVPGEETGQFFVLSGNSDGELYWNNKHVVRSINGIGADSSGNINIGQNIVMSGMSGDIWYRKWSDGFIEQGWIHGGGTGNETRNRTFTFPIPYTSTNYGLVGVGFEIANTTRQGVTKYTTGFTTYSVERDSGTLSWYAFGY